MIKILELFCFSIMQKIADFEGLKFSTLNYFLKLISDVKVDTKATSLCMLIQKLTNYIP